MYSEGAWKPRPQATGGGADHSQPPPPPRDIPINERFRERPLPEDAQPTFVDLTDVVLTLHRDPVAIPHVARIEFFNPETQKMEMMHGVHSFKITGSLSIPDCENDKYTAHAWVRPRFYNGPKNFNPPVKSDGRL